MPKKKLLRGIPDVHKDLTGFNIKVNEFGQIITNVKVDKLNNFLNENVTDKKLVDRKDIANSIVIQEEE